MSDLLELAAGLVRIESINPGLDPAGSGERAVARAIAEWCERADLDVGLTEPAPGRFNVVARARGRGGGRTLLLNGHTDTVGVAGMAEPFSGRVDGDRLYGRGAYDMKGALAAALTACVRVAGLGLRGDVVVTAVADEEVASVGTEDVAATVAADAAVVVEPTEELLGVAHRGFAGFHLRFEGRAAHGSRPDLGIDAIAHAGPVLTRLGELDERLSRGKGHPLLGTGSVHASVIAGGQEYSSYPASCDVHGERRTIPGESEDVVRDELAELAGDSGATWEVVLARDPFAVDQGEEIVRIVSRCAGDPGRVGLPFWTDAALLQDAGIPTVLFGPRGEGAHAEVEWVSIQSLERCADVLVGVAEELCA
jgi:acetylornithine deacetylase